MKRTYLNTENISILDDQNAERDEKWFPDDQDDLALAYCV